MEDFFRWYNFKDGKIAVNCKTKLGASRLILECNLRDIKQNENMNGVGKDFKECNCYYIRDGKELECNNISFYKNANIKIVDNDFED